MKLVEGIKDLIEYPIDLKADPPTIRPGEETPCSTSGIANPQTHKPVREFEVVHEKFYHLFVVSQDLKFFLHTHPERNPDEDFHLKLKFPRPGMYRVLSDFFPKGATPQLITNTVMVPGPRVFISRPRRSQPDLGSADHRELEGRDDACASNTPWPKPELHAVRLRLSPHKDMQLYLGTAAHMLAASAGSDR